VVNSLTGQFPEKFIYEDKEYDVVGIEKGVLFDPIAHGFRPFFTITACWRGFQLTFAIKDEKLVLKHMSINIKRAKKFNGKRPKPTTEYFAYQYEELNFPLVYTGGVLIARDFIQSLYVHMGFQSPTSYQTVLELTFQEGVLTGVKDLSEKMEQQRQEGQKLPHQPSPSASKGEVSQWIRESFSLEYKKEEE